MASPDHAATVRAASSHIARGCRAETSHDPTSYLDQIDAALDSLVAALAQAEHERDEARKHANKLGRELDEQGDELERAERQRDQAIEALNAMTRECDYCDGRGWYGEPDHGPDCTSDKCGAPCPVERQVPCPSCAGSGRRL